jgi:Ca2+-binding EF-hand superfamily protein
MGEPFRGEVGGPTPLADWFAVADRNHDGRVSLDEMLEDAARFFKTLDTDGNGVISPIEMAHYETAIAPARLRFDGGLKPFRSTDKSDNAGYSPSDDRSSERSLRRTFGSGRNIRDLQFLEVPQPVMMADSDFDQRVSADEFAKTATKRFKSNDKNVDGFLEPGELTAPLNKKGKPIGPGQVW